MKKIIFLVTASLLINQVVNANPPTKCPSAASIISAGFPIVQIHRNSRGYTFITQKSNYDTDRPWSFMFAFVPAGSKEEAAQKARTVMPSLKFVTGPFPIEDEDEVWGCRYTVDGGYVVGTLTPGFTGIPVQFK